MHLQSSDLSDFVGLFVVCSVYAVFYLNICENFLNSRLDVSSLPNIEATLRNKQC